MSFLTKIPPWKPKAGGGGGANDLEEFDWSGKLPKIDADNALPILWHREYIDKITAGIYTDQRETRYFGRVGALLRLPRVVLVGFGTFADYTAAIEPDDDIYLSSYSSSAYGLPVESLETVHAGIDDNGDSYSFQAPHIDQDSFLGGTAVIFATWAASAYLHVASNTNTHYHFPDIASNLVAELDAAFGDRFERVKLYFYRTYNDPANPADLTAGEFGDLTAAYQSVGGTRIELVTGTQFESALYNTDPATVTAAVVASDVIPKIQQFFNL